MIERSRGVVSRAELLQVLAQENLDATCCAGLLGYVLSEPPSEDTPQPVPEKQRRKLPPTVTGDTPKLPDDADSKSPDSKFQPPFWRLNRVSNAATNPREPTQGGVPVVVDPPVAFKHIPLLRRGQYRPLADKLLTRQRCTGRLDIERACTELAKGQPIKSLPKCNVADMGPQVCVLLDTDPSQRPVERDRQRLFGWLRRQLGEDNVLVRATESPLGAWRSSWGEPCGGLESLDATMQLLVISDLGILSESSTRQRKWQAFEQHLQAQRWRAGLLYPGKAPKSLSSVWTVASWERKGGQSDVQQELLTALAQVWTADFALLRALRLALPDAGLEQEIKLLKQRETLHSEAYFLVARSEQRNQYAEQWQQLRSTEALAEVLARYSQSFCTPRQQVDSVLGALCGRNDWPQLQGWAESNTIDVHWLTDLAQELDDGIWLNPELMPLAQAVKKACEQQQVSVGPNLQQLQFPDADASEKPRLLVDASGELTLGGAESVGFPLLLPRPLQAPASLVSASDNGQMFVRDSEGEFEFLRCDTPEWATSVGSDKHGLFVETSSGKAYWWPAGVRSGFSRAASRGYADFLPQETGVWWSVEQYGLSLDREPPLLPRAGMDVRVEENRRVVSFDVNGIELRMVWIPPGRFQMGSPVEEEGRFDNETQHEVILTKGYWLAETACTQALWQAVLGENPSEFKGENLPVENVSWEDIHERFLPALNQQLGAVFCLPTEAQWEYACRAGSAGMFSWGESLDNTQARYAEVWDYEIDEYQKVLDALRKNNRYGTTDVKNFKPNEWGLYQMHGNVWEWCEDGFGDYPSEVVCDPMGEPEASRRVLRGGSWGNDGRNLRSASRDHDGPGNRCNRVGFRLAQVP